MKSKTSKPIQEGARGVACSVYIISKTRVRHFSPLEIRTGSCRVFHGERAYMAHILYASISL